MSSPQTPIRIYLIAGEASGDNLGGAILAGLRGILAGRQLVIGGIGGDGMARHGLRSLFPMDELSVAGIGPVLARLPSLLRRIRQTAADMVEFAPDYVVTIDSPDFCFRVAARARHLLPAARFVHVGAPTVWAWRASRAPRWKRVFDRVLALLPFEPEAMRRLGGPDTVYVGHPLLANQRLMQCAAIPASQRDALLFMPGSRSQEVKKHLPLLARVLQRVPSCRGMEVIIPAAARRESAIRRVTGGWSPPASIVCSAQAKWQALARARVAVVASGTATLETALAGIPTVVTYKASWLWELLRVAYGVRHVALPNIICGREVMPEAVLRRATPALVAQELSRLLDDSAAYQQQLADMRHLRTLMQTDEPSDILAARAIMSAVRSG